MPKLLFFSRVAFLCNACFLITFLMHYIPDIPNGMVPSTIIIIGNVLAIAINVIMNVVYVLLFLSGRLFVTELPKWLIAANFVFCIFQVVLLVK